MYSKKIWKQIFSETKSNVDVSAWVSSIAIICYCVNIVDEQTLFNWAETYSWKDRSIAKRSNFLYVNFLFCC